MKLLGIGDSVVDFYKDQGKIYPGGSALNVAVIAKRNGAEQSSYMGILGLDEAGNHVMNCLRAEGIDISRVRRVEGPTGEAVVTLNEAGDRVFVGTNKEKRVQSLVALHFNQDDLDYIGEHELVHTCISITRGLEMELPKIADQTISFDFSSPEYWTKEYLELVSPYLSYAFFSGSELADSYIEELIEYVHKRGVPVVGVTRGDRPAVFSEKGRRVEQSVIPTSVVDTMGAGDSFIAAFLTNYHRSGDLPGSLQAAAECAAKVCSYYGAFGYGIEKSW